MTLRKLAKKNVTRNAIDQLKAAAIPVVVPGMSKRSRIELSR